MTSLLLAATAVLGTAVSSVPARVDPRDYPNADYVYLNDVIETDYQSDGTFTRTDDEWCQVLTEKGRRALATVTLGYSRRYGDAAVECVEIVGTNGVVRSVDYAATLSDATDNDAMSSNIYDPLDRTVTCTVSGLEVGEIRHVRVRRSETKPRTEGQFADLELLEADQPIVVTTVRVTGPSDRPLAAWGVRHPLGNVTESRETRPDGRLVWTWCVTNAPQAFPEPDMPPFFSAVQHVRFSTATNWSEISKWYWNLSAPHLAKMSAAISNKVEELQWDLRAIYDFVAQEIRYMGLTLEDASPGYAPHDVALTFENRYGVCRDKAALLVAMLRLAGYDAYPVLISQSAAKCDTEIPQPFFNHAIVAVEEDGEYVLMDPTNEASVDLLPAYLGDCSYLVARPEGDELRTTPVPDPAANELKIGGVSRLARDGTAIVEYELAFGGVNDNVYRRYFLERTPELRRDALEGLLRMAFARAELLSLEIMPADLRDMSEPLGLKMMVRYPGLVTRGRTENCMVLPTLGSTFGAVNRLLADGTCLEKRRFPLTFPVTAQTAEILAMDATDAALGEAAGSVACGLTNAAFAYSREVWLTNGCLFLSSTRALTDKTVSPEAYAGLRAVLAQAEKIDREPWTCARDPEAGADVSHPFFALTFRDLAPRAWVETNTVVTRILTYNGKKESADLCIPYNPLSHTVEFLSGTVSNADGTVHAVTTNEMTVMDADWVAAAPRYPPSRQLVVNAPALEIGSVYTYTHVNVYTNAPLPFHQCLFLEQEDPYAHVVIRANGRTLHDGPLARVPREGQQPEDRLWRRTLCLGDGTFADVAELLKPATKFEAVDPRSVGIAGSELEPAVKAVRDWMSVHVRLAGPSLYELPVADQLTDPARVLADRYASRLDYVRTLAALLRGAGYAADLVFAADDAEMDPDVRRLMCGKSPDLGRFAYALCRVKTADGMVFLGTENRYVPIGSTSFADATYLDPLTAEIGTVDVPELLRDRADETVDVFLEASGAARIRFDYSFCGRELGRLRKLFAEFVPEQRLRSLVTFASKYGRDARPVGDFETDLDGAIGHVKTTVDVPRFATATGEVLTVCVPTVENVLPTSFVGVERFTMMGVKAFDAEDVVCRLHFPAGYAALEYAPKPARFVSPTDPTDLFLEVAVEATGDPLVVTVRYRRPRHRARHFEATFFPLLRDWSTRMEAPSERTVRVRRSAP